MTPEEEFTALGKRLFGRNANGYGWQKEMNRQTGTPLRTIQAWASGDNPMYEPVLSLMRLLAEARGISLSPPQ